MKCPYCLKNLTPTQIARLMNQLSWQKSPKDKETLSKMGKLGAKARWKNIKKDN